MRPSVPLATPTAPDVPMYLAASSSKPLTLGPRMTRPLRSTSSTAASMRSCSSAYCPLMSMSPTAMRCASLRRKKSSPEPTTGPEGATGRPRPPPAALAVSQAGEVPLPRDRPSSTSSSVGDRPHRRLGPAGRLLPDAARERLHPGAERGDHALRRLRRERGHHDPPRHHRRRGGGQRRRLVDRLLGGPVRRPALHRQIRQVRAAAPSPRRAGRALVRQVWAGRPCSSAACCRSCAPSSRCPPASPRCRSGSSPCTRSSGASRGCSSWGGSARGWARTGRTSARTCTTPTTWWSRRWPGSSCTWSSSGAAAGVGARPGRDVNTDADAATDAEGEA